jgi:hypothetical protein
MMKAIEVCRTQIYLSAGAASIVQCAVLGSEVEKLRFGQSIQRSIISSCFLDVFEIIIVTTTSLEIYNG